MKIKNYISSHKIITVLIIAAIFVAFSLGIYFGLASRCDIIFPEKYYTFRGIEVCADYHGSANILNKHITIKIVGKDGGNTVSKTIDYDDEINQRLGRIYFSTWCDYLSSIKIYADGVIIGHWTGNLSVNDLIIR